MNRAYAITRALALGAGLACGGSAWAAPGCTLSSVSAVHFGTYDSSNPSPLTSSGLMTLCCEAPGLPTYITIDLSPGVSGDVSARTLRQGVNSLSYNLFTDMAHTLIWGNGFDGTVHHGAVPPSSGCMDIPVYGSMPAGQAVPAGDYSDSLTVTLTF